MNDDERIEQTMEQCGVGYDSVLRQGLKQLTKAVREDENRHCEGAAIANESRKTAEAIRARRES